MTYNELKRHKDPNKPKWNIYYIADNPILQHSLSKLYFCIIIKISGWVFRLFLIVHCSRKKPHKRKRNFLLVKKLKDTLLSINKKAVASTSWKHRQVSNCSQSKNKDFCWLENARIFQGMKDGQTDLFVYRLSMVLKDGINKECQSNLPLMSSTVSSGIVPG